MTEANRDQQLLSDFRCFRDECIRLRNTFNTYSALYESDDTTCALLHKVASHFFHDLNEWLIHSIILQVGRLTDPTGTGKMTNLTFAYFSDALTEQERSSPRIEILLEKIDNYREIIQPARNKIIAHADLHTYQNGLRFGAHSVEDARAFLESMQAFTDEVGNAIGEGPLDYSVQTGSGDVIDLISSLKQTVQMQGKNDSDGRR